MRRGLKHELFFCGAVLSGLSWLLGQKKTSLALGAISLALLPTDEPRWTVNEQLVVITGGSRGLGLALAKDFASRGARLALIARDEFELEEAKARLLSEISTLSGDDVMLFACDVSEPRSFALTLEQIADTCGPVDCLVNNAGSILVGPFETMSDADFQNHFNLHVKPILQSARWLLEHAGARSARLVNISSIGGRIAVPHMSPYVATKFALGGLSETLAAELASKNIYVTTVYPGLMQTGSPSKALFKGSPQKEYAWFSASDSTPGLAISAQSAAKKIVDGVCAGDTRMTVTWTARLGNAGYSLLPEIYGAIMRSVNWFLPQGSDRTITEGQDARTWVDTQPWYTPFKARLRKLEAELNQ